MFRNFGYISHCYMASHPKEVIRKLFCPSCQLVACSERTLSTTLGSLLRLWSEPQLKVTLERGLSNFNRLLSTGKITERPLTRPIGV